MKHTQKSDERIEEARDLLGECARESIALATNSIPSDEEPSRDELFDTIRSSLKHLGKGLYAAALATIGAQERARLNFYFWPGYDTIHQPTGTPRITWTHKVSIGMDREIEIPCGIGF